MFDVILKATKSSFQKGITFYRSIYVKKVMKLLAFIFEQPSYDSEKNCREGSNSVNFFLVGDGREDANTTIGPSSAASETPLKWRFAGGPMKWCFAGGPMMAQQ